MRVFVAIELNDKIKRTLSTIQTKLKSESDKGKYTDIDNFHLTLHFIGEVSYERYEEIKSAVKKAAEQTTPFGLSLNSLGYFPKKEKHIIWVGVKGDLDALNKLNQDIRQELENPRLIDDLKYTPHITLGRQIKLNQRFDELQEKISIPEMPLSVSSISLMESKRENGQLVYKPIYNKRLRSDEND